MLTNENICLIMKTTNRINVNFNVNPTEEQVVCRLKDIADAMSVSVNTVSRALNDKDSVSEELRKKIKDKAVEMGYVMNMSASSLRTGQTKTVAIVYDNFFNPYYAIVTGLLQRKLFRERYGAFIFSEGKNSRLSAGMVRQILARGTDGIISFLEPEEEALSLIAASGKALLVIGRKVKFEGVAYISSDDELGAYIAGKHLIECGHRKPLMFSARRSHPCSVERVRGFRRAFEEAGMPPDESSVLYIGENGENVRQLIDAVEENRTEYTAIFCFNDMMAFAAMNRLKEYGKTVPADVSVIGYDYVESNLALPVGLTTIDADKEKLAEAAVVKIISMLEGNRDGAEQLPPPVLVTGNTVKSV